MNNDEQYEQPTFFHRRTATTTSGSLEDVDIPPRKTSQNLTLPPSTIYCRRNCRHRRRVRDLVPEHPDPWS